MKLVLKILIWFIAGIIIFITALTVTAMVFRNQVVNVFIKSINNNLSTKFNFENYKLSFVKRFPKASVELTNVTVFSSDSFDRTQFYEYQTDTLFHADLILFEFSINDILNNHYSIQSASVSRGRLSLFSDSTGGINYNVSYVSKGNEDNVKINFEKVVLRDVKTNYHNKATSLNISGVIDNGRFRSRIEGSDIDFLCTSNIYITHFGLYSANFYPDTKIIANISLSKTGDQIIFKKGDLELEGLSFGISGFVRPQNELLLKITGSNIDVAKASKYLPQKYLRKYNEYTPDGFLDAECILSGPLSRTENLHTEITFSVKKGRIYYRKSNIYLKNMNLTGKFNNGYKAGPVTSRIDITQCSFDIGNAVWTANFSVENFNKPLFKLNFSGDIIPDEIQRFVKMPWLVSAEGSLRLNLKLEGFPEKKERYSVTDILNLNPQANIQLKSLTINHKDERFSFNDAAGNITVAENLWADNLVFTYKNQRIRINGEFINFPAWIAGKPVNIKINADVSADKINPVYFTSGGSIKINDKERALKMPGGIETDLVLKIDNFTHKNLKSSNINGTIKYRPGILTVENFSANTADGLISGSFFTSQTNRGSGFIFQGNFTINNININNCFSSFNNFGQNFIRAEHLSGSLSGTLKLLVQLDSLFKPDVKSLNAEGKYIIENGTLINFEPVMALSKFINIAELGNITFSKLENDLYIKNNYLAIPQMDIKSSAADFSVSGRHYFDNTYEYHVKTYLSELLSKKVKKSQIPTEFGSVEDDGLGRTYVFLKITGKGDDVKVAYDLKAAGMKIRQSLDNEKNNLKNILNEEYGLFKNDTLMKKEPAPRPKFQIEWIETDDKVIQQDTVSGKKEKIIDRIFKKKKNQNL